MNQTNGQGVRAPRLLKSFPSLSSVRLGGLLMLAFLCLTSVPVFGQGAASYFSQVDQGGDTDAAGHCLRTFSNALLAAGLVERPSTEVETLMRECVEDRSNPGFVRECDLSTARGQVNYVFLVGAEQDGEDWLFYIQALSPMMAGAVWQLDDLVSGSSALRAARNGCAYLAADFLYRQEFVSDPPVHRGGDDAGGGVSGGGGVSVPDALPAVVHIVSVTPSPATAYIGGRESGLAPGQFEVPAGVATEVELRSPGYSPYTRTVTVAAGATERLANITLDALPATLEVTANVQGADIVVDGRVVGTTILNRAVSVPLASGNRQVSIRLDGFDDFTASVNVAPGATQSLTAALSATPVAPPGFVYFAPATYVMGISTEFVEEHGMSPYYSATAPPRVVTLTRGFYLQATEVTRGDWVRVMGYEYATSNGCRQPDCPISLLWAEAVEFANASSRLEGLRECYGANGDVIDGESIYDCEGYRLPTEAEWEYAAAGESASTTTTHDAFEVPARSCCYEVNRRRQERSRVTDLLGNELEWVHDVYANQVSTNDQIDPAGPRRNGTQRVDSVYRGRGWVGGGVTMILAAERWPGSETSKYGFRLARSN